MQRHQYTFGETLLIIIVVLIVVILFAELFDMMAPYAEMLS